MDVRPEDEVDVTARIGRVWPGWDDIRTCIPAVLRGTVLGSLLGVLPGGGALLGAPARASSGANSASAPRQLSDSSAEWLCRHCSAWGVAGGTLPHLAM